MKIRVKEAAVVSHVSEIVAVGIFEQTKRLKGLCAEIDTATGGMIKEVLRLGDFRAKLNQAQVFYVRKGLAAKRVLLVGLGKEKDFSVDKLRGVGAAAGRRVRSLGLERMALPLEFVKSRGLTPADVASAITEGVLLGLYSFDEFKSKNNDNGNKPLKEV
ncbi:MAG: hypothetical protein GY868_17610, partial [Deltaproteobacteria bacterium]|nr:hypothetical protein [Deltaproteobacteria bacterium]